jgi:hypothetical protein
MVLLLFHSLLYWVVTLPSFSTLMCSLVEREWTLSSGKEALDCVREMVLKEMGLW